MIKIKERRYSMCMTTTEFCDANANITANLPGFEQNLSVLKDTCVQIKLIGEEQKLDRTGLTESKNNLKSELIVLAADNARKLVAYAKLTNNATLLAEIDYSETDFKRFANNDVKDYAHIIYERAQTHVAELGNYGITAETQSHFIAAIDSFNASLTNPRIGATAKSQATKQLTVLFKTANRVLSEMDAVVEIVRLTEPNFYNGYRSVRKVMKAGKSSVRVKGLVTDAATGMPIKGVSVMFVAESELLKSKSADVAAVKSVVTKKTAEKGGFSVMSLASGTYQVRLKKAGYIDQVVMVNVNDGEMSVVNVSMMRN
ncbi:MAG: carboxypeptidase regulatory-like domain-containing protein [Bacteroidales bacterium]|nr:carboxypeptidase regulatory-like domain-containing protein [Bacteroidales bacterium]